MQSATTTTEFPGTYAKPASTIVDVVPPSTGIGVKTGSLVVQVLKRPGGPAGPVDPVGPISPVTPGPSGPTKVTFAHAEKYPGPLPKFKISIV